MRIVILLLATAIVCGNASGDDGGWESLFNGKNLDGWEAFKAKPDTWTVRDGTMICSGDPLGFIRTTKEYENYVFEVEWRHAAPGGNSGIFFHTAAQPISDAPFPPCIEAQLLDGDHGSLFGIRGESLVPVTDASTKGKSAKAGPLEKRCHPAGEWNKYVITARGDSVTLNVNGKVVTRAKQLSKSKGFVGFQSEHSEIHFRNIRIRSLKTASAWKTGTAKIKITPENPMWMSGYGGRTKPATETEHDLFAKALVLENEKGKRAVLVTLDLVGIDRATSLAICNELQKTHGLTRDQIALNCSHTHSGPAIGRNLQGLFFFKESDWKMVDTYTEWLIEKVVSVVGKAFENIEPSKMSFIQAKSEIAVNRRNNKHDEVEKLCAVGKLRGPSDYSVPILSIKGADEKVSTIVFGYACHPTKLSGKFDRWCGDYAGFAQIEIEKAYPGAIAMFVQGCGGDQTPWPRGDTDAKEAEKVGKELALAIGRDLRFPGKSGRHSVMNLGGSELNTSYNEISLPLSAVPEHRKLAAIGIGKNKFKARLANNILKRQASGKSIRKSYDHYPVQVWQLGSELQWIFLGGEVVVDYSLRLKEQFGKNQTWVAGYSNDVMAYIPSERVLKEGGYEGGSSMPYYNLPSPWAMGIEAKIVKEIGRQANAIAR